MIFLDFLDCSFPVKKKIVYMHLFNEVQSSGDVIRWAHLHKTNEKLPGSSVELTSLQTTSTETRKE